MANRKATSYKVSAPLTLLDSIQGFYVAEALFQLLEAGVLSRLQTPQSPMELTKSLALHHKTLAEFLEFVARCSDVISVDNAGRFKLGAYSAETLSFQLEKFVGCYGPSIRGLANLLRRGAWTEPFDAALARAFAGVRGGNDLMVTILTQAQVLNLLDLGCGTAGLLIEMALTNPRFEGYGFDSSRHMYTVAARRVREAGLCRRVHIKCADARKAQEILGTRTAGSIEALYGRSFLNQFFIRGEATILKVLRTLKRSFLGRYAWFVDYYGELGMKRHKIGESRLGLLQDACQIVSGQGVPPTDLEQWRDIYRAAGCSLMDSENFRTNGIRWFLHRIQLGSTKHRR